MPDGLYDKDILLWAERQADLLRRLAAGERVNEQVDWANVIEEMEGVGRSELYACQSLLERGMAHLLKLALWPESRDVPHWRSEATTFLRQASRQYAPSMRQRIDMDALYDDALASVEALGAGHAAPALPRVVGCPYDMEELATPKPDIDALLARLTSPSPP